LAASFFGLAEFHHLRESHLAFALRMSAVAIRMWGPELPFSLPEI